MMPQNQSPIAQNSNQVPQEKQEKPMGEITKRYLVELIENLKSKSPQQPAATINKAPRPTEPATPPTPVPQPTLFSGNLSQSAQAGNKDADIPVVPGTKPSKIELSEKEKAMLKAFRKFNQ